MINKLNQYLAMCLKDAEHLNSQADAMNMKIAACGAVSFALMMGESVLDVNNLWKEYETLFDKLINR